MKKIFILLSCLFISSCQTNIIESYDCTGKEELVSKTYVDCIAADKELPSEQSSMKHNPVYACKDSVKELLCRPIYKSF